jgi:hypothetical protein
MISYRQADLLKTMDETRVVVEYLLLDDFLELIVPEDQELLAKVRSITEQCGFYRSSDGLGGYALLYHFEPSANESLIGCIKKKIADLKRKYEENGYRVKVHRRDIVYRFELMA